MVYADAVHEYEHAVGLDYFLSLVTCEIMITQISEETALSTNFGRHELIMHLIHNQIPVEWVNHAHSFRFQFTCQHLASGGGHQDEFCAIEDECIHCLLD